MRNIRIVTASAGTGKTTRLAELLDKAIGENTARPEGIIATTFTRQAAAELQNRARSTLLKNGKGMEAQALLAARIGTVNSVCGSLVTDFAFELGLSPEMQVLDEGDAENELKQALASVVDDRESEALDRFKNIFDGNFDWQFEVRRLIEASRANGIGIAALADCKERSLKSLDECLGPAVKDGAALDRNLMSAISQAIKAISANTADTTKGTQDYVTMLRGHLRELERKRLRWGNWAKLANKVPTKKSELLASPVHAAAREHVSHPELRADMHQLIGKLFDIAARGLSAYQTHKEQAGLLDYVDQEVWALNLLGRPDIRAALSGQIDLVLVDEFQDTSPLQLAIFLKLAELAKESVWVGDPKQAIFGFRGTDPALMDAAIQSLTNPTRDADLIIAAIESVAAPVDTLRESFRSRPALVETTNEIFATAFSKQQKMPSEHIRVAPKRPEIPDLGSAFHFWPLSGGNLKAGAAALAAGVSQLLSTNPQVFDPNLNAIRSARPSDIAVLCRTNRQCAALADELGQLGVSTALARTGLLDTLEAHAAIAGLELWIDGRDRLAAAKLARLIEYPDTGDAFVAWVIGEPGSQTLADSPIVKTIFAVRAEKADADVIGALDAVVDGLDLRRICAGWGETEQRIANLDALRAHAVSYQNQRMASGGVPSIVGFFTYLTKLRPMGFFKNQRSDSRAKVGGDDAVTLSTWHASKGLEWPIVILFGLEEQRDPVAYGVHVMSDRAKFNVDDPLGDRWLHFWPNPYTTGNQLGPVKDAYASSKAHAEIVRKTDREALRVLYVGWTRARDRLIFACKPGKMLAGIVGILHEIEPGLITEPPSALAKGVIVKWGKEPITIDVEPASAKEAPPPAHRSGTVRVGRQTIVEYPPARLSPSAAPPRTGTFGEAIVLGLPLIVGNTADVDHLGDAVHGFLAADTLALPREERTAMAESLLDRHGVTGLLTADALLEIGERLWKWCESIAPAGKLRREWPLGYRDAHGTVVSGTADLVIEAEDAVIIIDHKTYRSLDSARKNVEMLAGQLGCYADALKMGGEGRNVRTWVHLPFAGAIAPMAFLRL